MPIFVLYQFVLICLLISLSQNIFCIWRKQGIQPSREVGTPIKGILNRATVAHGGSSSFARNVHYLPWSVAKTRLFGPGHVADSRQQNFLDLDPTENDTKLRSGEVRSLIQLHKCLFQWN